MFILFLAFFLYAPGAKAGDLFSLRQCVDTAMKGSTEGNCSSVQESNACIGFTRAIGNSLKKTQCLRKVDSKCELHAHEQNSEVQWISVAAGHLAYFHECINKYYDPEKDGVTRDDPLLREFLGKYEDLSVTFGFKPGEILERIASGEKFGGILKESTYLKTYPTTLFRAVLEAADNPISLAEREENADEKVEQGVVAKSVAQEGGHTMLSKSGWEATKSGERKLVSPTGGGDALIETRVDREENPYTLGLDKDLFMRVHSAYRRAAPLLSSMDDFIKKRVRSNRSVKDIINKGKPIELDVRF